MKGLNYPSTKQIVIVEIALFSFGLNRIKPLKTFRLENQWDSGAWFMRGNWPALDPVLETDNDKAKS